MSQRDRDADREQKRDRDAERDRQTDRHEGQTNRQREKETIFTWIIIWASDQVCICNSILATDGNIETKSVTSLTSNS
jgi:hypothetical protein